MDRPVEERYEVPEVLHSTSRPVHKVESKYTAPEVPKKQKALNTLAFEAALFALGGGK